MIGPYLQEEIKTLPTSTLALGKPLIANIRKTKTTILKVTRIKVAEEIVGVDVRTTVTKIIKKCLMLQNETGCILNALMNIVQCV